MKFNEEMSFPHPVLASWLNDYEGAVFEVRIRHREGKVDARFAIACEAAVTQPDLADLLRSGVAQFGIFVKCESTSFRKLVPLSFPCGSHEFKPGALLNRVTLRPVIWAASRLADWNPGGVNGEFGADLAIDKGEILALGDEQVVEVSPAKIAPLETIFSLLATPGLLDGQLQVDLERPKITIRTSEATYRFINETRRSSSKGISVVMNAVYIPALMQVLDIMREGTDAYQGFRWYSPFIDRCLSLDIDLGDPDILEDAERLLEFPINRLPVISEDGSYA